MAKEPKDRYLLDRGWYWYDYDRAELDRAYAAFQKDQRANFVTRVVYTTEPRAAVVFEVLNPFRWTLPGLPTPAPKGIKTTLRDMANAPDPSPGFVEQVQELTGQPFDLFKRTGKTAGSVVETAGSASKVLLWGAAGVLLYQLFVATEREPSRG